VGVVIGDGPGAAGAPADGDAGSPGAGVADAVDGAEVTGGASDVDAASEAASEPPQPAAASVVIAAANSAALLRIDIGFPTSASPQQRGRMKKELWLRAASSGMSRIPCAGDA